MKEKLIKNKSKIIFVFSETKWEELPRMRHYITYQLARYYKVIYCELYVNGKLRKKHISNNLNIFSIGGYIRGINRIPFLKFLFDKYQIFIIKKLTSKYSESERILFNFQFDFIDIYKINQFKNCFLFINDDFINMNPYDSKSKKNSNHKKLVFSAQNSIRTFTSSFPLENDLKPFSKNTTVITSGHDFNEKFNMPRLNNGLINICYLGFLRNSLEIDWLYKLSERDDLCLNFVGPIEEKSFFKSFSKKNVKFLAPRKGKKLQELISQFDVFIIPYIQRIVEKVTVPAKLNQYIACGRPIVTSKMKNLIELPPKFVYQSNSQEEFISNIYKAREEDNKELYLKRIKYSKERNWDKVGEKLKKILTKDMKV